MAEDKVTVSQMAASFPNQWPWPIAKNCLVRLDKQLNNLQTKLNLENPAVASDESEDFNIYLSPTMPRLEYNQMAMTKQGRYYEHVARDSLVFVRPRATEGEDILSYGIYVSDSPTRLGMQVAGGLCLSVCEFPPVHTLLVASGSYLIVACENPTILKVEMASMAIVK